MEKQNTKKDEALKMLQEQLSEETMKVRTLCDVLWHFVPFPTFFEQKLSLTAWNFLLLSIILLFHFEKEIKHDSLLLWQQPKLACLAKKNYL